MFSASFLSVTAIVTNDIITIIEHGYKNCNVTEEDLQTQCLVQEIRLLLMKISFVLREFFFICLCAMKESYIVTVRKNIPLCC
jgi:hypothetical protein